MSLDKVKNAGSPIYSQNIMVDDEYSDEEDFEKTNHIFILNSKINELNIVIQKMSLQFQQNLTEQKNLIENIKSEYQSREHALFLECQKAETIAQAEKQAKSIIAKQLKSTKNVLQQVKMILEMPKVVSDQQLKQHLVDIANRNKQLEASNNQLENELEELRIVHEEEQGRLIAEFEAKTKRQGESYEAKIKQLQVATDRQLLQISRLVITIEEQKKKIQTLASVDADYRKTLRTVEQLQSSQTTLEAELNSLKVKEQIFAITKEKYQQTKMTMDEYVEQMTFKIGLQQKKLEIETARLNEERMRNNNLESMFCTTKQHLRLAEEKIASLEQNLQELEQKNSILEVYREKQKASLSTISELEEKNRKLGGEMLRLKQERDQKKNQFYRILQEKTVLEKNINKQRIEIEQLRKGNLQLSLKTNHQGELMNQMRQQINKNKQQLSESRQQLQQAKMQLQQVLKEQQVRKESWCESKQTLKQVIEYPEREMWQQMNQNIVKHYQQLLMEDDKVRLQLQHQVQQSRTSINQLKQQFAQTSRELNEIQQERQMLSRQNKRLLESIGTISKSHQQRVADFRQKFTQLQPVSPSKRTLRHFRSQKHLSISNCYNFTQHTHINHNNDSHTAELKIDRSESGSVENVLKKLVKYSSSDNFTEKHSKQGLQERSSELSESIRVLRDRNNNMRLRLNI